MARAKVRGARPVARAPADKLAAELRTTNESTLTSLAVRGFDAERLDFVAPEGRRLAGPRDPRASQHQAAFLSALAIRVFSRPPLLRQMSSILSIMSRSFVASA